VNKATGIITSLSTAGINLNSPKGVVVDAAGDVYIADTGNGRILEVTPVGSITKTTTVAGTGVNGYSGDGDLATSAQLNNPYGVALDAAGNIYITDTNNQRIRMVSAATGIIATVAGPAAPAIRETAAPLPAPNYRSRAAYWWMLPVKSMSRMPRTT